MTVSPRDVDIKGLISETPNSLAEVLLLMSGDKTIESLPDDFFKKLNFSINPNIIRNMSRVDWHF
jgi:hypothetical protein